MFRPEILLKISEELERGDAARRQGLEGRARVCARRAAAVAIRAYLENRSLPIPGASVMDLLSYIQMAPEVPEGTRQVAGYLLTRVDPSYSLPIDVDLLDEVRRLVQLLQVE